jgi:hypothetical protein
MKKKKKKSSFTKQYPVRYNIHIGRYVQAKKSHTGRLCVLGRFNKALFNLLT